MEPPMPAKKAKSRRKPARELTNDEVLRRVFPKAVREHLKRTVKELRENEKGGEDDSQK
jgi:uncharacterized protein YnzC (UPF0291/DUF896 family)